MYHTESRLSVSDYFLEIEFQPNGLPILPGVADWIYNTMVTPDSIEECDLFLDRINSRIPQVKDDLREAAEEYDLRVEEYGEEEYEEWKARTKSHLHILHRQREVLMEWKRQQKFQGSKSLAQKYSDRVTELEGKIKNLEQAIRQLQNQ